MALGKSSPYDILIQVMDEMEHRTSDPVERWGMLRGWVMGTGVYRAAQLRSKQKREARRVPQEAELAPENP
jgi:hypothetical protein